jgi:hypothetical protein
MAYRVGLGSDILEWKEYFVIETDEIMCLNLFYYGLKQYSLSSN